MSDIGVVVFCHDILIPCQSLLCCHMDFVHQVELKAHGLLILILVVVLHSIACEPYFHWDDSVTSVC